MPTRKPESARSPRSTTPRPAQTDAARPTAEAAVPEVARRSEPATAAEPGDTIARTRALPVPPASKVPPLPVGYVPASADELRRMRRAPADQRAALLAALRELADRQGQLAGDLGEFAPSGKQAAALADRIEAATATLHALAAQQQLLAELEDIALSDSVLLLEEAHEAYSYRVARRPGLSQVYPRLEELFRLRSQAISDGMARSRRGGAPRPEAPPQE